MKKISMVLCVFLTVASLSVGKTVKKRVAPDKAIDRGYHVVSLLIYNEGQKKEIENDNTLTTYQKKTIKRNYGKWQKEVFHAVVELDDVDGAGNVFFKSIDLNEFELNGKKVKSVRYYTTSVSENLMKLEKGARYKIAYAVVYVPEFYISESRMTVMLLFDRAMKLEKV